MSTIEDPFAVRARMEARAQTAIAKVDAADAQLQAGGAAWDSLMPAQRTMIIRVLLADHKRLIVESLDAPA